MSRRHRRHRRHRRASALVLAVFILVLGVFAYVVLSSALGGTR